ncbi:MAG: 4Fe-4S dicluster domain-containing protein [Deltaproteobacteria bacterium]|nr:4Fe-4S dicluster domain-containing protein [Deltaproteobacteria bacterium]MBW1930357.1 4Fe-4S dicluster domain-containing protein [Deltaproteobacteria bacterium]MBW2025199.1 4Fe-4S dicluster domain-containing protein [Deltaproteobacteria bacterium]MBW2125183.1 4Fe-4S dicluster domain-containing protein [Deltaproteobacteria bacterium]
MKSKVFTKDEWIAGLESLKESYSVFVPVKTGDFHSFMPLEGGKSPDFDYQNTRLSPKSLVYPESERMFEYIVDEKDPEYNIMKEAKKEFPPQAIVGIRPCDAHAFQIVKVNFDNPEYRDPWWVRRFEATTLVGVGCNEPCSTCFCASVGGGPYSEKGLDVLLYDLGAQYLAKGLTKKGEAFLSKMTGGKEAGELEIGEAEEIARKSKEKISSKVHTENLKDESVLELFNAPFWEDVAFACINCGTCTFLCPTCWCFDIQDELYGKQGDRIRNWDSCMFPLFTLHGSGHNPRSEKFQRVRQRFMHKLKYYVDKYGNGVQCSGCGRCVQFCPVNIDIRQVIELMNNH